MRAFGNKDHVTGGNRILLVIELVIADPHLRLRHGGPPGRDPSHYRKKIKNIQRINYTTLECGIVPDWRSYLRYTLCSTTMPAPKSKRDLTQGGLARNLWHLALPVMVSSALYDIFNTVDMIFVGRLGPEAIAAVSMSGILMGLIRMVVMGISAGTVALVSRFVGSRDHLSAESVLAQSLLLAVTAASVIAVAGHFLAEPVLRALGASADAGEATVPDLAVR